MKWLLKYALLLVYFNSVSAFADISEEVIEKSNQSVFKVSVALKSGAIGTGSAVAINSNEFVTNCHVVANSSGSVVLSKGLVQYTASKVKADWAHDVCVLQSNEEITSPVSTIYDSNKVSYGEEVFNAGFPGFIPAISNSIGLVTGKVSMDGSFILKTTSVFSQGQSGGGLFNSQGNLIGLITLKSPGKLAYYFNMPSRWIVKARELPAEPLTVDAHLTFWQEPADKWPYFMKIVHPTVEKNWEEAEKIATEWAEHEPATSEAWFALAFAEINQGKAFEAESHLIRAVMVDPKYPDAIFQLGLLEEESGKHMEAVKRVEALEAFDKTSAENLKIALNIK